MSEADLHLKDLLAFYVDQCHQELLNISEDSVTAETMFDAIKRTREIILVMSCMIGAVTPGDIEAIRKLSQIKLVAENESAQMLRVGEDMALLRLWLKSASDGQWNVMDAIRLLRSGKLTPSSSLPEMTCDLLTSVKKPFVVPSSLPSNWESIRRTLRALVYTQFQRAKREHPFVPDRMRLEFNDQDDSVTVFSEGEFRFRGIFDGRRWTIMEAQILDDVEGKPQCRQILQAISNSPLSEMCSAALRMATAQRLKQFQDEAVSLTTDSWSSVHSVSKSKAGLGNGFTIGLYKRIPSLRIEITFGMNFDNGDLVVEYPAIEGESWDEACAPTSSLATFLQYVERRVRRKLFSNDIPILVTGTTLAITQTDFLYLSEGGVVVSLLPSGAIDLIPTLTPSVRPVVLTDWSKAKSWYDLFKFAHALSVWTAAHERAGTPVCAYPLKPAEHEVELVENISEVLGAIAMLEETVFVCGIRTKEGAIEAARLNYLFEKI